LCQRVNTGLQPIVKPRAGIEEREKIGEGMILGVMRPPVKQLDAGSGP